MYSNNTRTGLDFSGSMDNVNDVADYFMVRGSSSKAVFQISGIRHFADNNDDIDITEIWGMSTHNRDINSKLQFSPSFQYMQYGHDRKTDDTYITVSNLLNREQGWKNLSNQGTPDHLIKRIESLKILVM